jgi:hypothetical protein
MCQKFNIHTPDKAALLVMELVGADSREMGIIAADDNFYCVCTGIGWMLGSVVMAFAKARKASSRTKERGRNFTEKIGNEYFDLNCFL